MSCAHDLALLGYTVTVFEKSPVPGGMLYLGIPAWRLPRDILRMEIEAIKNLGVEIRLNSAIGKDFNLSTLWEEGYETAFIAIGAHKSRDIPLEGIDLPGVYNAVEFLFDINMGKPITLGERVVVIGGGSVATDVARCVFRSSQDVEKLTPDQMKSTILKAAEVIQSMDTKKEPDQDELTHALDATREAKRLSGVKEIHMICLESRDEMPADPEEVEEAEEERIKIHTSRGPRRIVAESGKIVGLETIAVKSVFDDQGRFNPSFHENSESVLPVDSVILAIGQQSDFSWIGQDDGIKLTARGTLEVDPGTLKTTSDRVWVGGDAAFGPRLIVDAISNGKTVALEMHKYLSKAGKDSKMFKMTKQPNRVISQDCLYIPRHKPDCIPVDDRVGKIEVELTLSESAGLREGERCLQCNVNTVFDSNTCLLCGGCADVCPESCLELVDLDSLEKTEQVNKTLRARFGDGQNSSSQYEFASIKATAIIKDETFCVRCGLCAERCPVDAITMEKFDPVAI